MGNRIELVEKEIRTCDKCGLDFNLYDYDTVGYSGHIELNPERQLYSIFSVRNILSPSKKIKKYELHHRCAQEILDSYFTSRDKS